MKSLPPVEIELQHNTIERVAGGSSRASVFSGNALSAVILLFLGIVLSMNVYQLEFWQHYFFHDSVPIGNDCSYSTLYSFEGRQPSRDEFSLGLKPVRLPHSLDNLSPNPQKSGEWLHRYYLCAVPLDANSPGVRNLHLGWIYGDRTRVVVNSIDRVYFEGEDKPVVPLNKEDIGAPSLRLEVYTSLQRGEWVGFVGKTPVVMSSTLPLNNKVFGFETAFQQMRYLFSLLPSLTMAFLLLLGWMGGVRSRFVTTAQFYFVLTSLFSLIPFTDPLTPWNSEFSYMLTLPVRLGVHLALVAIGMELFTLGRRYIDTLMGVTTIIVVAVLGIMFLDFGSWQGVVFDKIVDVVGVIGNLVLLGVGSYKLRMDSSIDPARWRINAAFLVVVGAATLLMLIEFVLLRFGIHQRISYKMYLVMPFFVGGVVLYTLALIERSYRLEREKRARVEGDLHLAAKIQKLLIPEASSGNSHGWAFHLESAPFGILGGDWIKVHQSDRGTLLILGDVVGKGPSAALTHSGLAAIWDSQIKAWDSRQVSTEGLLFEMNRTMFDLYDGEMNTTFALAEINPEGRVRVACGGNQWLQLGDRVKPIAARGSLIGVKAEFIVTLVDVPADSGDWLVCYTDGVLEGNRALRNFANRYKSLENRVSVQSSDVCSMLRNSGRGHVHDDDASLLLLHKGLLTQSDGMP